jgi:ketosteroid isomerase-like protein
MTRNAFPSMAIALVLLLAAAGAQAQTTDALSADSAAVVGVIQQFHGALEAGDSATVLRLLHDRAIILETGAVETKHEYRSHHLPADIAFARAVPRESGPIRVEVRGDVAWATSTSIARGSYRDRDVNSQTAELMVLERTTDGWRIAAIHWSSRTLR